MKTESRRKFLGSIAAASGIAVLPGQNNPSQQTGLPVFNVLDYGIKGDGKTVNTLKFQSLIDGVSTDGGGMICFPPGNFVTGTFSIKSNVNIFLFPGATIIGSSNRNDYKNSCLVYAEDAENISITGRGSINGNGKAFWGQFMNKKISEEEMREKMWRPGSMIIFLRCRNILLENITVENSPAWTIHPMDCENVLIKGISLLNGVYEDDGPNTDGINPDGCSQVRISDCYIRCGDDCIVLKITNRPGGSKVCRDIVVTNCVLQTTETALKIGTETHGEFRNITFSNCVVFDSGGVFGLLMRDGGLIEGVTVTNINSDCDREKRGQGIYIWSHRRTDDTPWGMIRNVLISNMNLKGGGGIFITGVEEKHIQGLTLENIRMQVENGRFTKFHDDPPYPFEAFGHHVAPYDIFCRYADDVKLKNIQLTWTTPEQERWGSAIRCWHMKNLEIDGFHGRQSLASPESPAIWLKDVESTLIHNCIAPEGTGTYLFFDEGTTKVSLIGNELINARKLYKTGSDLSEVKLFETGNHLPV